MRALVPLLMVVLFSTSGRSGEAKGPKEANDKETSFEQASLQLAGAGVFQCFLYGYVPVVSAWGNLKTEDCHWDCAKNFPKELVMSLQSPGTKEHTAALRFVQMYAACARQSAF